MLLFWLLAIAAMDPRQVVENEPAWYLIWLGGLLAQPCLLAVWAALIRRPFFQRVPEALFFAALVGLVEVWNMHRAAGEHSAEVIEGLAASLGAVLLCTLLLAVVRWRMRWQIGHGRGGEVSSGLQFSLRQLLAWTTAIAIILAMARWIARGEPADNASSSGMQEMVLLTACAIFLPALCLPTVLACIGLVLADGRRVAFAVWAVFAAAMAPVVFYSTALLVAFLVLSSGGLNETIIDLVVYAGWFEIGFLGVLLGSLFVLRVCGYRLERGRIAAVPLLQPFGTATTSDTTVADGDVAVRDQPFANRTFFRLVMALTLTIIALGWPAWTIYWAKRQPEIDHAIEEEWSALGASAHVQSGKLTSCLIMPEDPQNAAAAFKKLRQPSTSVAVYALLLYGPPLTEDDVQYLNSLNSLKALQLEGFAITDTEVKRLDRLRGIERLSLRDTRVTDDGLKSLMGLDYLQGFEVSGGRITDAGLEYLTGIKGLRSLSLSNTHVTDRGLETLKGLKDLEHLGLGGTRITDAGLEHVGELKHLESLDLSRILVTDDGAPIPFGDDVDLSEPVWITWDDGRIMKRQHVTPRGPRITDAGLQHLRGLSCLCFLKLSNTEVTDGGVRTLQEFARLESLDLDGTRVTDAGLTGLAQLKHLHILNLRNTAVTNQGLAGLRQAVPGCSVQTTTKGSLSSAPSPDNTGTTDEER